MLFQYENLLGCRSIYNHLEPIEDLIWFGLAVRREVTDLSAMVPDCGTARTVFSVARPWHGKKDQLC